MSTIDRDIVIKKYINPDIEKFHNSDVKIVLENLKQNILKMPSVDKPSNPHDITYINALQNRIKELEADRPQGEWIEKPHKIYLPRDYEPDIIDYRDRQYNEEDHSIIQYWWHCNQCDYEADRWLKPTFNYCPHCGAKMKGVEDDY